jgi:hypothetical protein
MAGTALHHGHVAATSSTEWHVAATAPRHAHVIPMALLRGTWRHSSTSRACGCHSSTQWHMAATALHHGHVAATSSTKWQVAATAPTLWARGGTKFGRPWKSGPRGMPEGDLEILLIVGDRVVDQDPPGLLG